MTQNVPVTPEMLAELEALRAENARLKAQANGKLTLKISEKGGVSMYGLGRFPVTLYAEQWIKLLDNAREIKAFIAANGDKLSVKKEKAS